MLFPPLRRCFFRFDFRRRLKQAQQFAAGRHLQEENDHIRRITGQRHHAHLPQHRRKQQREIQIHPADRLAFLEQPAKPGGALQNQRKRRQGISEVIAPPGQRPAVEQRGVQEAGVVERQAVVQVAQPRHDSKIVDPAHRLHVIQPVVVIRRNKQHVQRQHPGGDNRQPGQRQQRPPLVPTGNLPDRPARREPPRRPQPKHKPQRQPVDAVGQVPDLQERQHQRPPNPE